ncbi:MAG: hypothetical protein P8Y09_12535, partial [Deltaproteobacteria bacterium]
YGEQLAQYLVHGVDVWLNNPLPPMEASGTSGMKAALNGVHVPTWIEPKIELLFNRYLGPGWLVDHDNEALWELIDDIPDEELWKTHYWLKI